MTLSWKDLNPKAVTLQSLDSLVSFLSSYQKQTKSDHITMRLYDLADNTGLSVTTLVRALNDLSESNIIQVIPNKGNNTPKTYVFKKDLTDYQPLLTKKQAILNKQTKELGEAKFKLSIYEDFMDRIKGYELVNGEYIVRVAPAKDGGLGLPLRPRQIDEEMETFDPDNYS